MFEHLARSVDFFAFVLTARSLAYVRYLVMVVLTRNLVIRIVVLVQPVALNVLRHPKFRLVVEHQPEKALRGRLHSADAAPDPLALCILRQCFVLGEKEVVINDRV